MKFLTKIKYWKFNSRSSCPFWWSTAPQNASPFAKKRLKEIALIIRNKNIDYNEK